MDKIKVFFILVSLLLIPAFGFCGNTRVSLPVLSEQQGKILPVDSVMGQVAEPNETDYHTLLAEAIGSEFGYEWLETYVSSDAKASISALFTNFLTENLPAKDYVMSRIFQNGDKSVSISVRINSVVVDFVMDGSYIVAMSIKKS